MRLTINGAEHTVDAAPERPLLWVLRNALDLTGTKYGCGEGQCGACTVLLDGKAVRSCLVPVGDAVGHAITTIEGLERSGVLHPVQQAFVDEDAMQCGYCTAGMILAAAALLREHPQPTDDQIRRGMSGNICRCGTYPRIFAAVKRAAAALAVAGSAR